MSSLSPDRLAARPRRNWPAPALIQVSAASWSENIVRPQGGNLVREGRGRNEISVSNRAPAKSNTTTHLHCVASAGRPASFVAGDGGHSTRPLRAHLAKRARAWARPVAFQVPQIIADTKRERNWSKFARKLCACRGWKKCLCFQMSARKSALGPRAKLAAWLAGESRTKTNKRALELVSPARPLACGR